MDANANQRKRGGRFAKNANGNDCMSPPQNEVMDVSAVAISPTLEEAETTTNAPAAECRRSSRKKIIKFDVRDLLNKNRKTHKIQIEARIDSNAPTTSKAVTAVGNESANPKSSTREDLLSKQKTFLEKSAIFRRYSISQDHKPPPPPLPMPPLLSKGNDNKNSGHSGNANSRRLSRTQEFFSNVMIKPKQTTSLIVAQIQSNTPCSTATAKRKNLNKSLEIGTKAMTSSENESSLVVQHKKRGRPAKLKTQTSIETTTTVEDKKITPEKAKNWKEYKACMAQQSDSNKEGPEEIKFLQQDEQTVMPKPKCSEITKLECVTDIMINLEETQQSDISKSEDDDGNFSGFKTSRDDLSCDSPVLEKISFTKVSDFKGTLNNAEVKEVSGKKERLKERLKAKVTDSKQVENPKRISLRGDQVAAEQKQTVEISFIKDDEIESTSKRPSNKELANFTLQKQLDNKIDVITTKSETKEQLENKNEEIILETETIVNRNEIQNKTIDVKQTVSPKKDEDDKKPKSLKRITRSSPEMFERKDLQVQTPDKEQTFQTDLLDDTKIQTCFSAVLKETESTDNANSKQPIRNIRRHLRKEDTKDIPTKSGELQDDKTKITATKIEANVEKILWDTNKLTEESVTITSLDTPTKAQIDEVKPLKTPDILSKAAQQFVEECTPQTELSSANILLLTSQMSPVSQPTTPSEETIKSFSRTSSSSESENASERSSYSSAPSSASSSSGRSYKSGDKLRVSLKRISLPKSPSTSSQTSTSEELNSTLNAELHKKKTLMGKRSKRLQKKFVDMIVDQDDSEIIDDCFQTLTNEQNEETNTTKQDDKEELRMDDQAGNVQITLSIEENKAEACAITKVDIEAEKSSKFVTHSIEHVENLGSTSENLIAHEDMDLVTTESRNIVIEPFEEKVAKRKSLRNRKDNSSEEKYEEIDKSNSNQLKVYVDDVKKQSKTKIQNIKQTETILQQLEKDKPEESIEKIVKKDAELYKISESNQSEESDQNKPKRKTRNDQQTEQQPQRKLKNQTSPILEQTANKKDKTTLQAESQNDKQVVNEQELTKSSNKDKSSMQNKLITKSKETCESTTPRLDKHEKSPKIPTTRSKTNIEEINVKKSKIPTVRITEIEAEETSLKDLSEQSSSKQEPVQKHESISDVIETNKNISPNETPIETDIRKSKISGKELNTEAKSLVGIKSEETKLNETAQSPPKQKDGRTNELISDVIPFQNSKYSENKSNSPVELLATTEKCAGKPEISSKLTTRSKTNKEEISTKESKTGQSTQEEVFAKSELMTTTSSETNRDRSKSPKEKSTKTDEELKIASTRRQSNKVPNIQVGNPIAESTQEKDNTKTDHKSELMQEKSAEIETTRSKSPKENSTKTNQETSEYIEDKNKEILSTKSKTKKEEISTRKTKMQAEKASQGDLKPHKLNKTARDRSESPKELSTMTDEKIKILSTRSQTNKEEFTTIKTKIQAENFTEQLTQDESESDLIKETTRDTNTVDEEPKILSTRSKTNNEDISTKETKISQENPTQDVLMQKISPETLIKTSKEQSTEIEEETKTLASRSKTVNEDISTKETTLQAENLIDKPTPDEEKTRTVWQKQLVEEKSSNPATERSKSPKEKLTTTGEETKNPEEKPVDIPTKIGLGDQEQEIAKKSKNKSLSLENKTEPIVTTDLKKSTEITVDKDISDNKHDKTDESTLIRSKINKQETSTNAPLRSISKKANILVDEDAESTKTAIKPFTTLYTPTISTTLLSDVQLVSSEISLEAVTLNTIVTLNKDADTTVKVISDLHTEFSEICIKSKVETPEIVTLEIDRPCADKRKSLRNQKDTKSFEEPPESTTSYTLKLLEESSSPNKQQEDTLSRKEQQAEEKPKATKRKARKSRFKNLYSPEVVSETDSSNGKNTPIEEITQHKLKEEPKSTEKEQHKEDTKIYQTKEEVQPQTPHEIKETDKGLELKAILDNNLSTVDVVTVKDTSANLLSSQIQNVSIETNTLLDILRRVQSNTEAALKASKPPTNISNTYNDNTSETANKLNIEELVKEPQESNTAANKNIQEFAKKPQDLLKMSQESKSSSPTRSDTESPLTVKKMNLSPARSDTSSPMTLKKVTQSPTRSDTSSPLTLKKVTRRYERRSRRGEDSAHKTLEETFAEIAAQSSKAVLAAKEFDFNEEQTANENSQEEIHDINTITNTENEQIMEIFTKIEKSLNDSEEVHLNVEEKVDTLEEKEPLPNVLQLAEDIEKVPDVIKQVEIEIKTCEKVVELQETAKVIATPARRGRKPKNRSLEAPASKEDVEARNPTNANIEMKEVTEQKLIETEVQKKTEETPTEIITQKQEQKNENKINKSRKVKVNSSLTTANTTQTEELSQSLDKSSSTLETNAQVHPTETSDISQTAVECSLKPIDDTNETKASKKSIKKRDTPKAVAETVTEDTTVSDDITSKDKEDEVRTPKQAAKKRDTSQTKSETKSFGKKLQKKTKNEEEDDILTKTTPSVITTTPPPSKRGRKPKNPQQETPQTKKKNKKESTTDHIEDSSEEKRKAVDSETESLNSSLDRSLDEKLAKKKRQKKLKEAFEAALTDDIEKSREALKTESSGCSTPSNFGLTLLNSSPPPERRPSNDIAYESHKITCVTPVEADEDPDPLKDIEKFIADGVNLLKKDYKLEEDSVDDVITSTAPAKSTEKLQEPIKSTNEEIKMVFSIFETPADTPLNTPSITPPPKSPTSIESTTPDENSGVRRSHRIKLITKTPKALVGRGLVRDKERFSIKDDVETKSHYTLDDHLTDLAEVEAKNAKFLKEMEERLSNFQVIKENDYWCERVISREARKMICDCFLTHEEEERGELGCGEDCLNRLLMIECGTECNVKERCTNKRFQKLLCSPCRVFRTEKKGFGIMADIEILPGEFIMEYVGEVIDTDEFEKRRILYSKDKNRHYYFMALRSDAIIDATIKGNISRFINHSCDPNAETQKWTVNGELRIGFFSRKSIMPGEEITFNYQYQRYGREAQRCYCESANCTGWIGQEPTSDEGEQMDDDDEYEESEDEEEADTSNLLVQDDDEDSDASVADPEEVQKQLEMAAAQAEVELAPLQLLEEKAKLQESTPKEPTLDSSKSESDEDSKSKFKKLLSKMAEKVAAKQKQTKREQKLQRKKKSKETSTDLTNKLRFLEDPDIEDEVEFLKECGLKNQSDTLRLSRLMVRAKLVQTRLNLLEILRQGDLPCRRLFLDYHGLRLVHGWMSEDAGNMQIRLALLQTLDTLPIANKTVLTDSKVMQMVRNWCGDNTNLSPSEDSSSSNSNSQDVPVQGPTNFEEGSDLAELQKLALKLISTWDGLPEIFRIPKKERIEQMKEHEREADRQYAANVETQENITATDRYRRDRFGRDFNTSNTAATSSSNRFVKPNNGNHLRPTNTTPKDNKNLSKAQRREMFAAKVARDEAEKRLAEERREFETKCRFFGLDPKKTRHQDIPFCVNPATGQWFSIERKPVATPPSYAHVQVPVKPKSTDPNDYQLPAVCSSLPPQWKYAITPQGKIYYYHVKHRTPQWEPPSAAQLHQCDLESREEDSESELSNVAGEDSSDDDDEILIGMDAAQLKAYIDGKVEVRRQKRYQRLVDERCISPRREEDRIYNQIEVRKYKENKEKIRKRKEEIRRKRAEALRQTSLNMCTLGSITDTNQNSAANKIPTESNEELGVLPIQDYLLSSDEEVDLKAEINSPLIDKIVEGDKIVDELDALTTKRQLKRPLPPLRDLNEPSTSSSPATSSALNALIARQEYKKRKIEKKEKRKPKEQDAKYRKNKEKFRCEIAGIIVHHLKAYRKETCTVGRIQSNEDFNHLARKLTHFVMIKELKYCESVGQTLVVTESVKSKSREFIKKYMAKYGDVYVKPSNDPDFKDIPFTL